MNGDNKKKKVVFDFSDLASENQEKPTKTPKKRVVSFDFSDLPEIKEPEPVVPTEEILSQKYSPEQMKGASTFGQRFFKNLAGNPIIQAGAQPAKTFVESLNVEALEDRPPLGELEQAGIRAKSNIDELGRVMDDALKADVLRMDAIAQEIEKPGADGPALVNEYNALVTKNKDKLDYAMQLQQSLASEPEGAFIPEMRKPLSPFGAGVRALTGIPTALGELVATPFTIGDATLREIGLSPVTDAAALPFHLAAQGVQSGEQAVDTILRSISPEVADLGLSEEESRRAGENISKLNQLLVQFLVPAGIGKGVQYAKGKIAEISRPVESKPVEAPKPETLPKEVQESIVPAPEGLRTAGELQEVPVEIPPSFRKQMVKELGPDTMTPMGKVSSLSDVDLAKAYEQKPKTIAPETGPKNTQDAVKLGEEFTQERAKTVWDEYRAKEAKAIETGDTKLAYEAQLLREQVEGWVAKQEGRPHEAMDPSRIEKRLQQPITIEEKVVERPLHEIPEPVAKEIQAKAEELKSEIPGFTSEMVGTKLRREGMGAESEVVGALGGGQLNTYPAWWGEVGANKQRIIEALEKIKHDKGKDKGILVERLKKILHEELLFGAERGDAGQIPPSDIYGNMIDAWKGGKLDEFLSQKPAGEPVRFEKTKAGEQGVLISEQRTQEGLGAIKSDIPLKKQVEGTMFEKEKPTIEQGAIFEETAEARSVRSVGDPLDTSPRAIEHFDGATVSDALRMPLETEALPGFEATKVSSSAVISSIADIMKAAGRDVRIRTGRFRERAKGIFKVNPEVIRLRASNSIPTAAHEAGHALQKILYGEVGSTVKALGGAPREVRAELYKLGRNLYKDTQPVGGYTSEGFAEFMRHYLTRDDAQTVAPNIYRHFQELLSKNKKIGEAINKAKLETEAYRKQGAEQRASANLDTGPTINDRIRKTWRTIRNESGYQGIDEFAPLQKLSETVEQKGVKLKPGEDPFQVASYLRGSAPSTVHYMVQDGMIDFARNKVGPALQEIGAIVKGNKENFTKYLWARRAQERWAKDMNPGMTKADADFIVAKLGSPEFELAAQKVYDWNNGVLRYVKDAVPDLAPTIEKITSESENYVPLQRALEGERVPGEGKGSGGLKQFKGSGLRVKDIFPQMIANAQQLISMAHRRRVLDSVIKLSDVEGLGHLIEEVPRDMVPVSKELTEIVRQLEKKGAEVSGIEVDGLMTLFTPMKYPKGGGDPIIPAMKDGKLRWFQVDPQIYRVLEGVDLYRLPKVLDLLIASPVRAFRLGTTGLRPAFSLFTNPARDIQTFITQSRSEKNPAQLAAAWTKAMAEAINPRRLKKESENFDLFYRLGVNMAQPLGPDIGITRQTAKGLFKGKPARIVSSPIQAVRELLSITEAVPRVAEIELIADKIGWDRKSPLTFDQAVELGLAGKRVTTDFTAAGRTAKVLNQMIPFMNANIQGTRTFARTLRENPAGATAKALTTLTIPTLLLWWQNKDEEWYKDMPDREKFLYWHFPVGNEMIKIPRAFEWGNFFSVMPEAIFDSWYKQDPEGVKAAIGHIVETTDPTALPHVLQVAKEQWQNRIDFFDRPIVPRAEEDLAPGEQFGPYTSELAKFLGKNFPESISPRRVDHLVRGIGGGATADLISAIEGIAEEERKKKQGMSEFPVIGPGAFRRGGVEGAGSKTVERFYEELQRSKRESRSQIAVETREQKRRRDILQDAAKTLKSLYLLRDLAEFGATTEKGQELQRLIKQVASDALQGTRSAETQRKIQEVRSRPIEVDEQRFKSMKRKEQIEALRRMGPVQRERLRGYVQTP